MLGKTHLVVGTSIALACIKPESLPELLLGTGVVAIGSLICDMDAESSLSRQKSEGIMKFTVGLLFFLSIAKFVFKVRIIQFLMNYSTLARILFGTALFFIICLHGKDKDHRTFMHSLAVLLILTFCANLIAPRLVIYFVTGFVSHLLLDFMNFQGLCLFWPLNMRYSLKLCKSSGVVNTFLLVVGTASTVGLLIIRILQFI